MPPPFKHHASGGALPQASLATPAATKAKAKGGVAGGAHPESPSVVDPSVWLLGVGSQLDTTSSLWHTEQQKEHLLNEITSEITRAEKLQSEDPAHPSSSLEAKGRTKQTRTQERMAAQEA